MSGAPVSPDRNFLLWPYPRTRLHVSQNPTRIRTSLHKISATTHWGNCLYSRRVPNRSEFMGLDATSSSRTGNSHPSHCLRCTHTKTWTGAHPRIQHLSACSPAPTAREKTCHCGCIAVVLSWPRTSKKKRHTRAGCSLYIRKSCAAKSAESELYAALFVCV